MWSAMYSDELRSPDTLAAKLAQAGYVLISPGELTSLTHAELEGLDRLHESWDRLPRDLYLKDNGKYRSRRHSCFIQRLPSGELTQVPHRAHYQPTVYNALHGGMERWFEPVEEAVVRAPEWTALITQLGQLFARVRPVQQWHIEAHQFRIDTANGLGRPTPEGAHRDGVDFVAVILLGRHNVRGGETRVFDAHGPTGVRFTIHERWSALLMDDEKVIHETTPLQAEDANAVGYRDTLVLTYREQGFLSPE